jgi:hypothetical protein
VQRPLAEHVVELLDVPAHVLEQLAPGDHDDLQAPSPTTSRSRRRNSACPSGTRRTASCSSDRAWNRNTGAAHCSASPSSAPRPGTPAAGAP